MKHIFFINRFSLKERTNTYKEKIEKAAKELKLDYKIEINDEKHSTEDIIKKYQKGENIIYSIGGDGTLNRIVNSIVGTKNKIGCIPAGTGNDFNRSIMEDCKEGDNLVDLIKCNDRYFINVACFGVDADIANDDKIVHNKFIPKSQQYNVGVVKHIILFKPYDFTIEWGKKKVTEKFAAITVCNGHYYGGGYHINPSGVYDDGKLDAYLIRATNRRKLLKYLFALLKSKQDSLDLVEHITCDKLTISCDKDFCGNLDGEELLTNKFEMSVIPKAITVYYNKKLIDLINS